MLTNRITIRTGACRLRVQTIASDTGLSERPIRAGLRALVRDGHIAIRLSPGASCYGLVGGPQGRPSGYRRPDREEDEQRVRRRQRPIDPHFTQPLARN